MKILSKTTYLLFAIIAPILFLLVGKIEGGIIGVKYFLFATGCFEIFTWFMFLMDYDWFPKHFEKENKND